MVLQLSPARKPRSTTKSEVSGGVPDRARMADYGGGVRGPADQRATKRALATELRRLYEAAEKPTYGRVIRRAREEKPRLELGKGIRSILACTDQSR